MCLTLRSLVFKVNHVILSRMDHLFLTWIQDGVFARLQTSVFNRSWTWTVLTQRKEVNLESKLLKVRHMSRTKSFDLGLPKSISNPVVFKRAWPPLQCLL